MVVDARRESVGRGVLAGPPQQRGVALDADDVRRALVGWRPPDCRKVWAVSEKFLGESAGIWQYAVDMATESMLVEDDGTDPCHP